MDRTLRFDPDIFDILTDRASVKSALICLDDGTDHSDEDLTDTEFGDPISQVPGPQAGGGLTETAKKPPLSNRHSSSKQNVTYPGM